MNDRRCPRPIRIVRPKPPVGWFNNQVSIRGREDSRVGIGTQIANNLGIRRYRASSRIGEHVDRSAKVVRRGIGDGDFAGDSETGERLGIGDDRAVTVIKCRNGKLIEFCR